MHRAVESVVRYVTVRLSYPSPLSGTVRKAWKVGANGTKIAFARKWCLSKGVLDGRVCEGGLIRKMTVDEKGENWYDCKQRKKVKNCILTFGGLVVHEEWRRPGEKVTKQSK